VRWDSRAPRSIAARLSPLASSERVGKRGRASPRSALAFARDEQVLTLGCRADFCFAIPEQSSEESAPVQLVLVHSRA
jgi:hypothetical protein